MEQGLFGLYSWKGNKLNLRQRKEDFLSSDPRYVEKEFNYISELKNGIGNEIMDHLKSFTSVHGIFYDGIKSFDFQEYKTNNDEIDNDKIVVQEIINKTYFVDKNGDGTVDWLKLNILRRMKKRGYDEDVARQYIDEYANKSLEILQKNNNTNFLDEKQKKALMKQSLRKCNTIKDTLPFTTDEFEDSKINNYNKKILLEELLIPEGKQMILSSNKVTNNYKLNPKAIINPWISNFNMGYMSWNMVINKSTISCLLNPENPSSNWLFPARLILEKNPNDLFFENCFEELNNKEKTKYLGFFLIRYNLPDEKIPDNVNEECKHLYSFSGSKPHKSKEQYYVMFVFKKLNVSFKAFKYFIVNFRCNKIPWGDTSELTKILLSEIRQINCMYVNDKVKLYLLLKKKTNEKIGSIREICKTQKEEEDVIRLGKEQTQDKKSYLDCNEAWLHKDTFNLLTVNNILPYTVPDTINEKSNIHLLCTKNTIEDISFYLDKKIKSFKKIDGQYIENSYYIELDEKYILTECHFLWETDNDAIIKSRELYDNHIKSYNPNSKGLELLLFTNEEDKLYNNLLENQKKYERFLIKHGPLDDIIKKKYQENFCIKSSCIKELDSVRFNILQSLYNVDNNNKEIFTPDFIFNKTFTEIKQSFIANQQTGGNNDLSKLKFNKYVKKYYELVDIYDKNNKKDINSLFNNYIITDKPNIKKLFYNKNNILINGNDYKNNTNFITTVGIFSTIIIPFIKLNNILIVTHNIAYADKICSIFKNIKITLLVINNYELGSFLTLKKKYNYVDIYFLGFYFNCLEQIKEICKNNIYNTILIDPGRDVISQIISTVLGILLCKDYLHKQGTYIQYCLLPDNINYTTNYIYIHNLLYKCFNYHINNDFNLYFFIKKYFPTLLIYNNFTYNINKEEEKILLDIMYNYYTNYNNILIKTKLDILPEFDSFLTLRWKGILFRSKEYLKTIYKKNNQEGGYHRIAIKDSKIKIPQTVDDLQNKSTFNGDVKDMAPSCHWGQKKLLLSEIQFFTNICKKLNIKNLKDYIAVYIGAADGAHLPILFNLFPELNWLLYDPNPFNKHVKNNNKVKIFNQYFLDETVKHVLQHSLNKKILFISDIRVTPKDEEVMTDMINQAKWGTELDADFMLLKFRLPYNEPTSFIPKTIKDLKLNSKISNNEYIAKDTVYLKGTVYLQLYHPQYSTELRLLVEKKNNKYELDNYDYIEIENKIFNYNTEIRLTANIEGYDFLNLIPGYDKSIENIMEYEIVKEYYEYFHNILDYKDIVKKLYDMNFYLEKLTYKKFIYCGINSIEKAFTIIKKDNNLRITKMKLWREIMKMNTLLLSKFQMNYIKKHGKEILGEERYNKAIQYLTNNTIDTLLYVKLYNNN